ncbi:MAG: acyltransferase [bacterium]|nr:acyltransferase [bacterium]
MKTNTSSWKVNKFQKISAITSHKEKLYFPGINALRFFAALGVIITHVELLKGSFGFENCWTNPIIFNLGGLGVYFFFVLSGFLITYLLLEEKEKYGTINIKSFYIRRILRIWPLYYIICVLGFFILPYFTGLQISYLETDFKQHFASNLLLYLLILPNLAFSMFPAVPHIGQLWSIGVEEQFYLVWPWLISKAKNLLSFLVYLILAILVLKIFVLILGHFYSGLRWYQVLKNFVAMSKFECMAIGGIAALIYRGKLINIQRFVYNARVFNLSLICIPFLILFTPDLIQDGIHILYSFIFLIIILYISSGKKLWVNLETGIFSYLGKISYGIYMYHLLVIPSMLFLVKKYGLGMNALGTNFFIYLGSIFGTIFLAGISYSLVESPFIKLKSKYAIIRSSDEKM